MTPKDTNKKKPSEPGTRIKNGRARKETGETKEQSRKSREEKAPSPCSKAAGNKLDNRQRNKRS